MTTNKNEVIPVQVESVEGEYVSPNDYIHLKKQRIKDEIDRQRQELHEMKMRALYAHWKAIDDALAETIARSKKQATTKGNYQYYWEKKNRQKGYKKIKNIDQIVFWVVMIPMLAACLLIYIGYTAAKIGAW